MRIVHLAKYFPPDQGGIESYVAALCRHHGTRAQVTVLAASGTQPAGVESYHGARVQRLRTLATVASTALCPGLPQALRAARPDLVHLHLPNPPAEFAWMTSGRRVPLVVSYHSDVVRQRVLGRLVAPLTRAVLRDARTVIVSSEPYRQSSSMLRPFAAKCTVIPYGIEMPVPCDAVTRTAADIRTRFGTRIVLTVGRLSAYKGHQYLVRAMRFVDAHLLIVGEGAERPALERMIHDTGLGDRVTLVGRVDTPAPYYASADVFVLPSIARSEAFGIVQLEAMAYGVPVVNTSIDSGVTFVSREGETGVTVPPREPAALADGINALLRDEALRRKFGAAGRRRVETTFSETAMADATWELYRSP